MSPATELMLMIFPWRFFIKMGVHWRIMLKVPFRLVFTTASNWSSFIMATRPSRVIPAQLTRMSTEGNAFFTAATVVFTAWKSATSHWYAWAVTPRAAASAQTDWAAASLPA